MRKIWMIVGVIWVLALLAAHTTAVSPLDLQPSTTHSTPTDFRFAEPRVDLFGNEVSEAVGDYRVDPGGDLYERHAPDTAVLKLGPPGV